MRARTYRQLLDSGMRLIKERGLVSVAEIAAEAGVSRATAYRYFPSRSRLVSAVIEESLGPVRRFESARTDGRARLRDLFEQTFPRFTLFEPHMRAAMQLALEHWAMARAEVLAEEPFRRRAVVRQHVAHVARLPAGVADDVAGVGHLELRQLLEVGVHRGGEASQQAGPVTRGDGPPALEGGRGPGDGGVSLLGARPLDGDDELSSCGVADVHPGIIADGAGGPGHRRVEGRRSAPSSAGRSSPATRTSGAIA